jgi:hypothetical protein
MGGPVSSSSSTCCTSPSLSSESSPRSGERSTAAAATLLAVGVGVGGDAAVVGHQGFNKLDFCLDFGNILSDFDKIQARFNDIHLN